MQNGFGGLGFGGFSFLRCPCEYWLCNNVDELLTMVSPPCASIRGHKDAKVGYKRPEETFFDKNGIQKWGVNVGVVVFKPDSRLAEHMQRHVADNSPAHIPSGMPEQAYISRVFGGTWNALAMKYNYQTHQLLLAARDNKKNVRPHHKQTLQ